MEKPAISVIIPVYNMEKYLKRCVDSVLNQTFRDLEIILVDDGSNDNSGKMCDELQALDPRIKVVHKQNAGLGLARNSGMQIAEAEYISFVDSDDYVDIGMYEKLYGRIKQEDADTCIFGYNRVVGEKTVLTRAGALQGTYEGEELFSEVFLNTLGSDPSCLEDFLILWQSSCLSLYSLEVIRQNNLSFPSEREFISEDALFITDYFHKAKRVCILNEAFYFYWNNDKSLTKIYLNDRFNKCVVLFFEHLRRLALLLPEERRYLKAKERVERVLLANARYCIMQICAFNPRGKAIGLISEICNNETLQGVLREYPWRKNPFKYRIFNYGIKKKRGKFLYFLVSLKRIQR